MDGLWMLGGLGGFYFIFLSMHLNHRDIFRHTATFSTKPITAWHGALRQKRNACETKNLKPPRMNLRFARENYPQRIRNAGSHAGHQMLHVAAFARCELRVNVPRIKINFF